MNPYFSVILAAMLWGTGGIALRYIHLSSLAMSFFRVMVPTLIVLTWLLLKNKKLSIHWSTSLAVASILNAIRMYLYFIAYTLTTIGNAVITVYTWPIFASIFGALFFHERVTTKKIVLLFISFAGMILLFTGKTFSFGNSDIVGMIIMLISSATYALTIPIYKKELAKTSKLMTIYYQNVAGAILYLPIMIVSHPQISLGQGLGASAYGLVIGLVCFFLFFEGLRHLSASTVGALSYIEVITSVTLGAIILHEPVTMYMIAGATLILGSSYFLRFEN
jgi:drug/metabolite transporter (DMT)-like permease